ncbi:MAG: PCRF domain-containing protein, partial [Vicinamibacteria bacterium]
MRSNAGCRTFEVIFDEAALKKALAELEQKLADPAVWSDPAQGQQLSRERRRLQNDLDLINHLNGSEEEVRTLIEWAKEGEAVAEDLKKHLEKLGQDVEAAEIQKLLGGENDAKNAIVSIHPGAGGTESQDWAEMLLRMYLRWSEQKGLKTEMLDYQEGEEAGLKSATFIVSGPYVYGLLSSEVGVHRL